MTYGIAFLFVLIFVPKRLLGPLALAVVASGFLSAGMSAGLPFYAFGGITWMAIVFAAIVLRHRDADVAITEPATG